MNALKSFEHRSRLYLESEHLHRTDAFYSYRFFFFFHICFPRDTEVHSLLTESYLLWIVKILLCSLQNHPLKHLWQKSYILETFSSLLEVLEWVTLLIFKFDIIIFLRTSSINSKATGFPWHITDHCQVFRIFYSLLVLCSLPLLGP